MSQRRGRTGHPAPRADLGALRSRLRDIIEPVVAAAGYDVEGLDLSRAGRRHLVRLTVDGDGGVNLDAVAVISRQVSKALDAAEERDGELLVGEYELQVSSPGVDRPLTAPRHWRRNVGRLVQVKAGERQVTGRVLAADADGVVLDVGGTHAEVPYGQLGSGRVQLEFTRLAELTDDELDDLLEPGADDDGTGNHEEEEEDGE